MELRFDPWHLAFVNLIQNRAPPNFEVLSEVRHSIFIVITDEVTEVERDEYLRLFSHRPPASGEATWWLTQWMKEMRMKQPDIKELQGYEEMFRQLAETMPVETRLAGLTPEQRLAGLALEQRLAGLAPEQRLAGLAPEHVILALPLEGLRALSEEYVRSLPVEVQAEIWRRVQGAS